jgi:opacity protein-like surface antigen
MVVFIFLCVPQAEAQFTADWKSWYGHVAAAWTLPQGDAGDVINNDFSLLGGATYYPSDWPVGIALELGWSEFDMTRETLQLLESSGGDVTVWQLTADLLWSPRSEGNVGFYLEGGGGWYSVDAKLREPATVCGPVCPPWVWWCYIGCAPGSVITDSASTSNFGLNLGAGLTYQVGLASHVYVEVKYHRIDTPQVSTEYIPIIFGYRW